MSNEIVTFDTSAYVDKLREKIKQSMLDVIPDEQWNALAKTELEKFFKPKRVAYSGDTTPSEFEIVVKKVVEEHTMKFVRELLTRPEWASKWDAELQAPGLAEQIGKLMEQHGPKILNAWIGQAFGGIVSDIVARANERRY